MTIIQPGTSRSAPPSQYSSSQSTLSGVRFLIYSQILHPVAVPPLSAMFLHSRIPPRLHAQWFDGAKPLNNRQNAASMTVRYLTTAPSVRARSEEHTSELQSLMRISYAVFGLITKKKH